jgi:hypothetical protein
MFSKTTAALMLAAVAASCAITAADARAARYARPSASSFAPARMIEVRPGLWVGSYQCVTDLERGGRDCSSRP